MRLGAVLSDFPYGLLVTTDNWHTADRLVVDGLLASRQAHKAKIWVYYEPKRRAGQPFARDAAVNHGVFLFNPMPGVRVTTSHLRMLRDADVAIIVGGAANSYAAGIAASLMRVRLIPVAAFGGAGRVLWQQLSDQFDSPIAKLPARDTWENLAGPPERVIELIRQEIATFPQLMIVHGRSSDRVVVERILRSHNVTDPIVLQERFKQVRLFRRSLNARRSRQMARWCFSRQTTRRRLCSAKMASPLALANCVGAFAHGKM